MVKATTSGPFSEWLDAPQRAAAEAVKAGVEAAVGGAQTDMRQALDASGVNAKVGRMVSADVYPKRGGSMAAAGVITARGKSADAILSSMSASTVIVPKTGKYLTIPTHYNRVGGRRGETVRVTPAQMIASKMAFVVPIKQERGLVWCLRLTVAQTSKTVGKKVKRHVVRNRTYAGGVVEVGGGRTQRVNALMEQGYVPMFYLLPQVTMPKNFDPDAVVARWAERIPALIERALPPDL